MGIREKRKWGVLLGVSAALVLAPLAQAGSGGYAAIHAAEQQKSGMSKEEALQWVKKRVNIPDGYQLEDASYEDAERSVFHQNPAWQFHWSQKRDGFLAVSVDAQTGQLLSYSLYGRDRDKGPSTVIPESQAEEIARQFLERVVPEEERAKLSKPNEFGNVLPFQTERAGEHVFTFTRIENGVPFLENGVQVTVWGAGQVVNFTRTWFEGALPEPKGVMTAEAAAEQAAAKLAPSLVYTRLDHLTGDFSETNGRYTLVYRYHETDPQFLDARTGTPLNAFGEPASRADTGKPLGTATLDRSGEDRVITREEAEKLAGEFVKRLPGTYRSDGSRGGGSSSGPDGLVVRYWDFEFTPLHTGQEKPNPIEIAVSDRGRLVEYRADARRPFREEGKKIEKAVSWEQARESAVSLVKTLLSDQLGEIALQDRKPSEETLRDLLNNGREYSFEFQRLHNGIPVQGERFQVGVDPETGKAIGLRLWDRDRSFGPFEPAQAKINLEQAKEAERTKKTLILSYYLPQPWKVEVPAKNHKPLLVYRYVGEEGVVDAGTGQWLSFRDLRKQKEAEDIVKHPAKEALQYAIQNNMLEVKNGKVEPDKPLTRGEMAGMLVRMINRGVFHDRLRFAYYPDDEESKPYVFADVDRKHPQYAAIQRCVQMGLIPKEGTRFEPDRPITRGEAVQMAMRLFGYEELMGKREIFVAPYADVEPKLVPAVSLAYAHGLFPATGKFEPNRPMTRAEAAQLMRNLEKAGERP